MSLTDTLGSLAVATKGQYMTGVSVDIGTSFIKPAGKVHDVFTAEAVVDGIGTSTSPPARAHLCYTRMFAVNALTFPSSRQIAGVHQCQILQRPGSAGRFWSCVSALPLSP